MIHGLINLKWASVAWLGAAIMYVHQGSPRSGPLRALVLTLALPAFAWMLGILIASRRVGYRFVLRGLTTSAVPPLLLGCGVAAIVAADPYLLRHVPGIDWDCVLPNTATIPSAHEPDLRAVRSPTPGRALARVAWIGDSITESWLQDGRAAWDRCFAPLGSVNLGVGGDRVENVLWRVRHGVLDGLRPRLVVLLIGTNNLGRNTPTEIADGIAVLLAEVRYRCPEAEVLIVGLLPRGPVHVPRERTMIAQINGRLGRLADGGPIRFLDVGDRFLNADGAIQRDLLPSVHLSPRGYAVLAEALRDPVTALAQD